MLHLTSRLWHDQCGNISPAAYLLLLVILAVGMIPGLATVREHLVQDFGDLAVALENLDQSYSFSVGTTTSEYNDPATALTDGIDEAPAGISVNQAATSE